MKKLWEKSETELTKKIETFTVGEDREWDLLLAPYDVLGSIAHVKMLAKVKLLPDGEARTLVNELQNIYREIKNGNFKLEDGVEDIHSQVEILLTQRLGDVGKKIHMARSRNDQVLVDIKLFLRAELTRIAEQTQSLFKLLMQKSAEHKSDLLPGYTHLQLAMPSSFGLWFGAYAESLTDDMTLLYAAYDITNKNPLGSAAGYGSSFPIDRMETTKLLGFSDLNYNVVYAQMGRGKTERVVAMALSSFAETLSRLSMDACLFLNQNFDFFSFPNELTTGSSIMPHKKNPDVFELIRARMNRLKALPNEIAMITTNLPSGYHRDLQIIKEHIFPALSELRSCMEMAELMFTHVIVKKNIMNDLKYLYAFSVEEVNRLALSGTPFRDAYKKVGDAIDKGIFKVDTQKLSHTHEGSIGNLSHEPVKARMEKTLQTFAFEQVSRATQNLLKP